MSHPDDASAGDTGCPACGEPLVVMTGDGALVRYCTACGFEMRQTITRASSHDLSTAVARVGVTPHDTDPTEQTMPRGRSRGMPWMVGIRERLDDRDITSIAITAVALFTCVTLLHLALGLCAADRIRLGASKGGSFTCVSFGSERRDMHVYALLTAIVGVVIWMRPPALPAECDEGAMALSSRRLWAAFVTLALLASCSGAGVLTH